jgi:hypothetical protein
VTLSAAAEQAARQEQAAADRLRLEVEPRVLHQAMLRQVADWRATTGRAGGRGQRESLPVEQQVEARTDDTAAPATITAATRLRQERDAAVLRRQTQAQAERAQAQAWSSRVDASAVQRHRAQQRRLVV